MGGRLSDHGLERFYYEKYTDEEINKIFRARLPGSGDIWPWK
ncbi:MAG: hypothetical protein U0X39_05540 [Bacteroidales bacterium]